MHSNSMRLMSLAVEKHLQKNNKLRILDVGSFNVNGIYKGLFDCPNWEYVGLDIKEGPNVDIVVDVNGEWQNVKDESFDVVISGQALEHIELPWVTCKTIQRVLKTDGLCIIIVPWIHAIHRYPVDCWRILPDGMSAMMTKWCNFSQMECFNSEEDTFFVGRKLRNR